MVLLLNSIISVTLLKSLISLLVYIFDSFKDRTCEEYLLIILLVSSIKLLPSSIFTDLKSKDTHGGIRILCLTILCCIFVYCRPS